jgi:predicted XRE-type DNA-binding protein
MENTTMSRRKVTRSSGNVFKDIGLPNPEQHALKAKTVSFLAKLIEQSGLTQSAAAERIGIKQPDLSKLLRGNFAGFSLERLLLATNAMGVDFEIKFKEPRWQRYNIVNEHKALLLTPRVFEAQWVSYFAKKHNVSADTVRKAIKRIGSSKKSARHVRENAMAE